MGVLINKTEQKSILIQGTEILIDSVYGRLTFVGREDGQTLEVAVTTYASKEAFKQGASPLSTDIQVRNLNISELSENETQGVETAHKYAIQVFSELGYEATEL